MDSYKLDQTDIKILNLLQHDGLTTNRQLSRETHKTHNPINERVSRLKNLGYIKKTVAIIDLKKVKSLFTAYTLIQLNNHSKETFLHFQHNITHLPQIMECYHLTGQYDFILKIMLSDLNAYNDFLSEHIATLNCVAKVESFPMLAEIKKETAYEL